MGSYWHPFADMAAVSASGPLVIASGDGAYVTDEAGRRYLDATAALWYCNVGHGRAALGAAAAAQMSSLAAYTTFGDYATRPTLELAERVAAIAPVPGSKVFLTSGGSDSVDSAIKLARRYWQVVGRPEKTVVLSRRHGYHGMHTGGTSLSGIPSNRLGYGPLLADTAQVPWDSAEALAAVLDATGPDRVAAFFVEPVVGAGGVFPPPAGYLESVEKICRDRDVLLVCDEVITGYGRIGGFWFGATRFGLQPDIVTGAKGVTSGYAPLGTVLVAPRVADPFWRAGTGCGGTATPTPGTPRRAPSRWRTSTSSSRRTFSPRRPGSRARCTGCSRRSPTTTSCPRSAAARARWPPSRSTRRPWPSTPRSPPRWPGRCARTAS